MEVKVEKTCPRCGKVEERTIPLEAAQALEGEAQKRQDALASLAIYAGTLDPAVHPEVIVIWRGEGQTYYVDAFDGLCSSPDAKKNKGCLARVGTLIQEIFTRPENRAPRKPRTKKVKEPQ
jgi:hypothetical protein